MCVCVFVYGCKLLLARVRQIGGQTFINNRISWRRRRVTAKLSMNLCTRDNRGTLSFVWRSIARHQHTHTHTQRTKKMCEPSFKNLTHVARVQHRSRTTRRRRLWHGSFSVTFRCVRFALVVVCVFFFYFGVLFARVTARLCCMLFGCVRSRVGAFVARTERDAR